MKVCMMFGAQETETKKKVAKAPKAKAEPKPKAEPKKRSRAAPAKKDAGEKKKKAKKDPNAPKKALSAFMFFSSDKREEVNVHCI